MAVRLAGEAGLQWGVGRVAGFPRNQARGELAEGQQGQHRQLLGELDGRGSPLLQMREGQVRSEGGAGGMEGLEAAERWVQPRSRRERMWELEEELAAEGERGR